MKKFSVLVVDDHPFIRAIVKSTLEKSNFEVIAEASSGIDAIKLAKKLNPDLIILDISMPKLDGLEVLNRLVNVQDQMKVLILTSMIEDYYALRCVRAGAMGYISKTNDIEKLLIAAEAIMAGYTFFPKSALSLPTLTYNEGENMTETELISKLSPRELSILIKLSNGKTINEIAEELMLSSKTISTYKSRIINKLNIKSIIHLSDFTKRNNL
ncbi:response regulator [Yersinia sp. 2466 StPb PI]|uniref:response regulator n=1 Tax=Yersinia TaxID=629 RepID=UPI00355B5416